MTTTMSHQGLQYSAVLHVFILLLLFFGLPSFLRHRMEPEPQAFTVDILPIAPVSNIKPQEKIPERPAPKKTIAEHKTEKKAVTETHKKEPVPEQIPEPITPKIVKKVEKKKPEKKPEKKQKKQDDLDSILKSVKDSAKAEESKKPAEAEPQPEQKEAVSQNYNPALKLSRSEIDAIRKQVGDCWVPPAGAKDAYKLAVDLHITVSEDGTVTMVERLGDNARYASDSFFRAAADAAIRAVKRCSPLKNLPADKYDTWRDMTFTFDPKDMY